jgi:polyvinyl alcohol dehydrogenase (cytochrome)
MKAQTRRLLTLGLGATIFAAQTVTAQQAAQTQPEHPGKAIYDRSCGACHNNPEATKAPAFDTLKRMRIQAISYALTQGKMQTQAAGLSESDRSVLIDYLVGREVIDDNWTAKMMCTGNRAKFDARAKSNVATFGFDLKNHRHLTKAQAGLSTADFSNLELAWAIGFPKATTMRSQAAIVGTTMYLPVADNSRLFAFDIAGEPCIKWVYQSEIPLRTSAAFGELPASGKNKARKVLAFGDLGSHVHLVDAETGQEIWRQHVGLFDLSLVTGTPVIHKDRVYVPISQYEITIAADNKHECCKTHGGVTALNIHDGKKIWTMHTMEDAKPLRDRGDGKMYWGPSGAPIWNSPAIDEKRGLLYVGTGEATSDPAHKNTNAILAVDMKDGSIRWSFQATPDDIFLPGCGRNSKSLNCTKAFTVNRDVDFGASMMLVNNVNGKDLVIGGQKSGEVWALDRDTGKVVWQQPFGEGSPLGGIHWGLAFDGERIYAPINRPYGFQPPKEATQKPGIHAVKAATGEVLWTYAAQPDCTGDRQKIRGCATNIGLSGAPTVIDGAVVEGSVDGFIRAFDARTGAVLFQFDTAREFETLNGVQANGGAIDNASIVAANGMLFVNSGYGMFGQMPGNVMLAFKPKAKAK